MADIIRFLDLQDRDKAERDRLGARRAELDERKAASGGKLPKDLEDELNAVIAKLANMVVDPLFIKVQEVLEKTSPPKVGDHDAGLFPTQQAHAAAIAAVAAGAAHPGPGLLDLEEKRLAAVYGLLELDHQTRPELNRFEQAIAVALGEYTKNDKLFDNVLATLGREGDIGKERHVRAKEWARVVRTLVQRGVKDTDIHLRRITVEVLADQVVPDELAPSSATDIDLPDLEEQSDIEIVAENLHAMQALYFAAMLDELKLFQTTEKLVEQFQLGMLPLGRGNAGDQLYRYWKKGVERISELERRNMYARAFGFPGGEASQGNPNREFNDLWLRFVSATSSFLRQLTVDNLLQSNIPMSVSQEQVRKSGRDLAANLSLHGYGVAYFAATEIQQQIDDVIKLLSNDEIKMAYGARDMWQVVDQVATLELGGPRNSIKYRTMATSGAVIIRWLADRRRELVGSSFEPLLNIDQIRRPMRRTQGKPTTSPTDHDLVNACEQWLAVTGTPDERVEEFAQPSEGPMMTSRPVPIPSVARDMLEAAGVHSNGFAQGLRR